MCQNSHRQMKLARLCECGTFILALPAESHKPRRYRKSYNILAGIGKRGVFTQRQTSPFRGAQRTTVNFHRFNDEADGTDDNACRLREDGYPVNYNYNCS